MLKTVLLGGTRGMGRAVGRKLAERGDALFLLGRDPDQLDKSVADFAARGPVDSRVAAGLPPLGEDGGGRVELAFGFFNAGSTDSNTADASRALREWQDTFHLLNRLSIMP